MVFFKCNKCLKIYDHKGMFSRHINRKNPCTQKLSSVTRKLPGKKDYMATNSKKVLPGMILDILVENDKSHTCSYCCKTFSFKSGLSRHVKHRCCAKKTQEKIEKEQITELVENVKVLQDEIVMLKKYKPTKKSVINNTINTVNNSTINNITISTFGKENMAKIDKEEIRKALMRGFYSTLHLINAVHFNPAYPENQNVYISNMRNRYAHIVQGGEWKTILKTDLVDQLYNDKRDFIESHIEEHADNLTQSQLNALERFFETKEKHEKITEIKTAIKFFIYDNKDIPLKNKPGPVIIV